MVIGLFYLSKVTVYGPFFVQKRKENIWSFQGGARHFSILIPLIL